jgi:hypothetical protein
MLPVSELRSRAFRISNLGNSVRLMIGHCPHCPMHRRMAAPGAFTVAFVPCHVTGFSRPWPSRVLASPSRGSEEVQLLGLAEDNLLTVPTAELQDFAQVSRHGPDRPMPFFSILDQCVS